MFRFHHWAFMLAASSISTASAAQFPEYRGLTVVQNASILEVTLSNPDSDINLWGEDFQDGLTDMVQRLQVDNEIKVIVFKSDKPQFFCAHVDLLMPGIDTIGDKVTTLMYNITTLPQVTIGAIEGRARGAGNEFLMNLDMRFATTNQTLLGVPETGLGISTAAGGAQLLAQVLGRGRAMEYVLSGRDVNAREAEKIGWINKAFDERDDMYAYIRKLTGRLALFPLGALSTAKKQVNSFSRPPLENYLADTAAFGSRMADQLTGPILARSMALSNNMSLSEFELDMGAQLPLLYDSE